MENPQEDLNSTTERYIDSIIDFALEHGVLKAQERMEMLLSQHAIDESEFKEGMGILSIESEKQSREIEGRVAQEFQADIDAANAVFRVEKSLGEPMSGLAAINERDMLRRAMNARAREIAVAQGIDPMKLRDIDI